jgi:hypothetical protein
MRGAGVDISSGSAVAQQGLFLLFAAYSVLLGLFTALLLLAGDRGNPHAARGVPKL